jgi:predicted permease
LIAQSLMESLLLSLAGAILGFGVAALGKPMLLGFLGGFSMENSRYDLSTDGRVVGFAFGVSLLTTLLFGMLPAIRASRADPAQALRNRSATGASRLMLGRAMVVVQVGLSVLLVFGAGLMVRTFNNLARVKPGFNPDNVLLFRIRATDGGYSVQQAVEVLDRIRHALATIPGVRGVTFSNVPLVSGSSSSDVIELPAREGQMGQKVMTNYLPVGEDFFRTMEIPILLGRDVSAADSATSPPIAVVNEMFARRYFPGENPVGRTFKMDSPTRTIEIVGVARDTKYNQLRNDIVPVMFLPHRQSPTRGVTFSVRSSVPPFSLLPAVRQAVATIDPNLPLSTIRTQRQVLDQSVRSDRLFASLGSALAGLAVLLSCIGLLGLMAYNVARRIPEIGVRMALGATRAQIARPILREALVLTLTGLCIGVPLALALVRLIRSQLYHVSPTDPLTLAGGCIILIGVAAFSAWLPAWRAARVDPMVALRAE